MGSAGQRRGWKVWACALLGVGLLIGCSPSDPVTPPELPRPVEPTDPYAGGRSYPWSDAVPAGSAGFKPVKNGPNFLSDLSYTSASNAWGPIELDKSNGSEQAGDGQTLKMGTQTFVKGIGVHAGNTLTYALGGQCSVFTATVGIDAEVGTKGSVVFQVYGDGKLLTESGTLRGAEAGQAITADVSGVKELKLVVTDGGDGIDHDHANWADARVNCDLTPPPPPPPPPPNTYQYSPIAPQPVKVAEAQGEAVGGQLYVFGGFDNLKTCCTPTHRAQRYDPATNTWTALAPMPERGATHAGMTTDGTSIYYAGGYGANAAWTGQVFGLRSVWRYNVAQNTYTALPGLPLPISAGQLEYLAGKLHYFGGTNPERNRDLNAHYVLDLAAGATVWKSAAPLPVARNHLGSVVLKGRIYAIGGQTGHDDRLTTLNTVEVYNPASDVWTPLAPLPTALSHITNSTFVLDGRILVVGGETAHNRPVNTVSAYDPQANTWTAVTPLPQARVSGVAGAVGGGFIFTGGNSLSSGTQGDGWRASPVPAR